MDRLSNLHENGFSIDERIKAFDHSCEDCGSVNQDILICYKDNYEELFYCPDCLYEEVYESEALSVWERQQ